MRHYVENETYASFATSTFYLPGSSQFQNKKISQQITCYDFPNRCCFTTNLISAEDGTDRISPSVITQIYKNMKYRMQTEHRIHIFSSRSGDSVVATNYISSLTAYNFNNRVESCCASGIWILYSGKGFSSRTWLEPLFFALNSCLFPGGSTATTIAQTFRDSFSTPHPV